jgi:hypothetical protein
MIGTSVEALVANYRVHRRSLSYAREQLERRPARSRLSSADLGRDRGG